MTYSSRNFLISCGVGSEERAPRFSKRLSSAMMSLQTSTHSSQMNTVGPAINFRTSFWSLLQNEHRRTSVSPAFFTMLVPDVVRAFRSAISAGLKACTTRAYLRPLPDDIVNNTVFFPLVGRHDVVAIRVILDTLEGLTACLDENFVEALPHPQDLFRCYINIGRLAGNSRAHDQGLVDDDP